MRDCAQAQAVQEVETHHLLDQHSSTDTQKVRGGHPVRVARVCKDNMVSRVSRVSEIQEDPLRGEGQVSKVRKGRKPPKGRQVSKIV